MYFYVPDYLEQDFEDSLSVYGRECVLNYNSGTPTPTTIYANINSLEFKANAKGLMDTCFGLEVSRTSGVKKGDYLTTDGTTYLVNWTPYQAINCLTSQCQTCSVEVTFERWTNAVMDSNGITSTPNRYTTIASNVRSYDYRFSMGFYDSSIGSVGIPDTQKLILACQYNTNTSNIQISDEFSLNNRQFTVIDLDYSQLNPSGTDGLLIIYSQVQEGGRRATT